MSGLDWRRGACVFVAFAILAPLFSFIGKALTDSDAVAMFAGAIGGAFGAVAGLAIFKLLFGPEK